MNRGSITFGIGNFEEKSVRKFKGRSIIEFPGEYVVIDLETTGLSPEWDRIIEIGAIKVQDGKAVDTFQQLAYPGRKISSFIEQLTGITNEMLEGMPLINDVLPLFDKFVGDGIVVGHNVNFDVNFLYEDYENVLEKPFSNDFIDTMRISRKLYPELAHHRMIDIVEHLKIDGSSMHRALSDCEYTYKCYEKMKEDIITVYHEFDNFKKMYNSYHHSNRVDLRTLTTESDDFDETHPLYKKQCVFTGTLEKYSRQEAAQIVVNLGGICGNNVTKKTNYLILGNNEYCSSIKDGKSSKQKKAEEYKLKGQDIEIIPESVFYEMIGEA